MIRALIEPERLSSGLVTNEASLEALQDTDPSSRPGIFTGESEAERRGDGQGGDGGGVVGGVVDVNSPRYVCIYYYCFTSTNGQNPTQKLLRKECLRLILVGIWVPLLVQKYKY